MGSVGLSFLVHFCFSFSPSPSPSPSCSPRDIRPHWFLHLVRSPVYVFFPTRSSGIPPFSTDAASPARGRSRIHSWKTFLLSLSSSSHRSFSSSSHIPLSHPFLLSHAHHFLDSATNSSNIEKQGVQNVAKIVVRTLLKYSILSTISLRRRQLISNQLSV